MVIKWLRQHLLAIMAVYVILLPVVVSGVTSSLVANGITSNRTKIAHIEFKLQQSQISLEQGQLSNGCHRLNVLRMAENNNDSEIYQFFVYTGRLLELSAKHPTNKRRMTKADRKETAAFAKRLTKIANRLTWTPLTNCALAERQGLGYKTPLPRTFHRFRYRLH